MALSLIANQVRCLRTDERGAVSVMMGLLLIPLRSEEHTSELQSRLHLVCRLLLAKQPGPRGTPSAARPGRLSRRLSWAVSRAGAGGGSIGGRPPDVKHLSNPLAAPPLAWQTEARV